MIPAELLEALKFLGFVFTKTWWIFLPVVFGYIWYLLYMNYIRTRWFVGVPKILLEIEVPRMEEGPKIMESVMNSLWGINKSPNLIDKYMKGETQLYFSLELVGIDGHVHFFIWTPSPFRDLVEAGIYSHYPDAVIKEVEDYTKAVPSSYPHEEYELWGTDIALIKDDVVPIRTYMQFEEPITGGFVDPLANITESMTRLAPGAQVWIQWLVKPKVDDWPKKIQAQVDKLLGKAKPPKIPLLLRIIIGPFRLIAEMIRQLAVGFLQPPEIAAGEAPKKEEKKEGIRFNELDPGQQDLIQSMQISASKAAFEVQGRLVHVAKKDVFTKANVAAFFGALRQVGSDTLNGFKPDARTKTGIDYFMVKSRESYRKRKVLRRYRSRSFSSAGYHLNAEEVATVYHFPHETVETPTLQRVVSKRAAPPSNLPVQ